MANTVRPITNEEIGKYMPVRELLDDEARQVRAATAQYIIMKCSEGSLSERPLFYELDNGTQAVHHFSLLLVEDFSD